MKAIGPVLIYFFLIGMGVWNRQMRADGRDDEGFLPNLGRVTRRGETNPGILSWPFLSFVFFCVARSQPVPCDDGYSIFDLPMEGRGGARRGTKEE